MAIGSIAQPVNDPNFPGLMISNTSLGGGGSLFNPNQLSLPGPAQTARDPQYAGMPDDMYNAMIAHQQRVGLFGIDQPVERSWDRWMAEQRQQQPSPYGGMTPGQALGGEFTQQPPSPYGSMTPGQALGGELTQQQPVFEKGPNYAGKDFGPSDLYASLPGGGELPPMFVDTMPVLGTPVQQPPTPTPGQQLNTPTLGDIAQTPPPGVTPDMIAQMQAQRLKDQPWLADKGFNPQEYAPQGETRGDQWIRDAYAKYQAGERGANYDFYNPGQKLNSPSLDQIAQTPPVAGVPTQTQPPQTQQVVQQITAPTTPTPQPRPSVPMVQPLPSTQQLLKQIAAPTAPRPAPVPNRATQQFAQQFRPTPPRTITPPPRPIQARPLAQRQVASVAAPLRPLARSVSRVNPPLLPSRPMARR